jgi:hypothetical protein
VLWIKSSEKAVAEGTTPWYDEAAVPWLWLMKIAGVIFSWEIHGKFVSSSGISMEN